MQISTGHDRGLEPLAPRSEGPSGGFVLLEGEETYRIAGYHLLDPFLINLASDTDLWMFITSNGGLTAGRANADGSLFPYLTSDRLADAHHHTGPVTLMRVRRKPGHEILWMPFSGRPAEDGEIERNLYKNVSGSRITFEETDRRLGLRFRYRWAACDELGWVRTASIENLGEEPVRLEVLDGLRNILPWGAPLGLYQQAANLVDAYKRSELEPSTGLGIYSLTAGITDKPEALEVLRANVAWCCGLEGFQALLSLEAIDAFREDGLLPDGRVLNGRNAPNGGCVLNDRRELKGRHVLKGRRGNYLITGEIELEPAESAKWHITADAGLDHTRISELLRPLASGEITSEWIEAALRHSEENLRKIVASADGLQLSRQLESSGHHFANVLFNSMRGGVFLRNDEIPQADFRRILRVRNDRAEERHGSRLAREAEPVSVHRLREIGRDSGDPDLARIAHEYLPLYFGRRHGDPSRPWNRFEIRVRDRNGDRVLHHEGNWRDIFQNWEALGASFPSYLPNMVCRFVNASTVDGFNPYRISQDGVDWEVPAPDDPWGNIGYWGDHQIVYLLRLLEAADRHDPKVLPRLFPEEIFSYADVPYRIKPYGEILRDPRATIEFDFERAALIEKRVERMGTDGRLLADSEGSVYHANLLEKLLVPALSKMSSFIPEAGIWMNTQRPEWNDANNALGGGSVSVVTLCHLRRYLEFLRSRLEEMPQRDLPVSSEVVEWFGRVAEILGSEWKDAATGDMDPSRRKKIMDALSGAFSEYREAVYAHGFTGRKSLETGQCAEFCRTALKWVDQSIATNRRTDGLYHTYNQLEFSADLSEVRVTRLEVMLEGQVAVLGSGAVRPDECLAILESMFASQLHQPEQKSFLLYPEKELPGFLERNVIPERRVASISLMNELPAGGDRSLWTRDDLGAGRFHGDIRNSRDVAAILDELAAQPAWRDAVARDRAAVLELFEEVFNHRLYTGRSGVMYGYEGIGCIYWHMVAKLLLAVQEAADRAEQETSPATIRQGLTRMYFRVQAGLGYRKTVEEFGAFPTDPYSHTPSEGGAKQPGMTGQVKEEILTRFGELGVQVEAGTIRFRPRLLSSSEFLEEPASFRYFDLEGRERSLSVPARSLAFTFCQVPIVYEMAGERSGIEVTFRNGSWRELPGATLDRNLSREVFGRTGRIEHIRVGILVGSLYQDDIGA